jgi:hypothetical protein
MNGFVDLSPVGIIITHSLSFHFQRWFYSSTSTANSVSLYG